MHASLSLSLPLFLKTYSFKKKKKAEKVFPESLKPTPSLLHRHRCLPKRRRKFPACSFLTGRCPSPPELTEKDFVKVKA